MAGFPDESTTISAIQGLIDGGVDIIEIGFPFSDPLADGPVIQNAANASIKNGMTINKFFDLVKKIKSQTDIPLILMTYANILYHTGYDNFVKRAQKSGIDGIIIPDMSIDESAYYLKAARTHGIDTIFLTSPNTQKTRINKILKVTSGFLYMVAVYGTTGSKTGVLPYSTRAVRRLKKHMTASNTIPIGVGFGVSSPSDVKTYVDAGANAVIVGSTFLKLIQKTPKNQVKKRVAALTKSLKKATIM